MTAQELRALLPGLRAKAETASPEMQEEYARKIAGIEASIAYMESEAEQTPLPPVTDMGPPPLVVVDETLPAPSFPWKWILGGGAVLAAGWYLLKGKK